MVDRRYLRDRVDGVRPKILGIFAPAGFGKTTFLRKAFAGPDVLWCNCAGVRDDIDLARRLLPWLSDDLGDGGRTVAERLALALDAFAGLEVRAIIFDGAEAIGRRSSALEFFTRLLGRKPSATIVVSSREPLALRLTRFAPPHEVLVLRARDLAFTDDEIRSLFTPYVTDAGTLAHVAEASRGWPIVLLLLLRLARERRLRSLLGRLKEVALVELHEYLSEEVLSTFEPPVRHALFACAAVPMAEERDVRDLFADAIAGEELSAFAGDSPFLTRNADGWYEVHPIIAALMLAHQDDRRRLLLTQLALQREAESRFVRAAQFYSALGDEEFAASALAQHPILQEHRPSRRYLELLAPMRASAVARYPVMWGMHAALRMFREPIDALFDEAQALWRTIPPDAHPRDRIAVFVLRVMLMGFLGRATRARAEVHEMLAVVSGKRFETHLTALRAFLRARSGALSGAQDDADRAMSLRAELPLTFLLMTLGAEIARSHGDRMEIQLLERAIEHAKNAGFDSLVALMLAQSLCGAWLSGEHARAVQFAQELDALVDRGYRGFARLTGAMLGRETAPSRYDVPEFAVYADLIELTRSRDSVRRSTLAKDAYARARQAVHPFLEVLGCIAVALTDQDAFDEYMEKAREASSTIESPLLARAVLLVAQREADCGMLTAYVNVVGRVTLSATPPIQVSFVRASVHVDGAAVELGGRELELLLAIGLRREASSRVRLTSLLWPDLDEDAGRNAFGVCLHRLRSKLRRKDAIEREGNGYRLHANAHVDLWEIERLLDRSRETLARGREQEALERYWLSLSAHGATPMERWEWFEPVGRRLQEARVQFAHLLAAAALDRGDIAGALRYADDALAQDACDERAAEIGIRAHLLAGDRATAMRRYRQYRSALEEELGAEPSFTLTALVTTA